MTRKLKKGIALFLTILMVVTMWTVPVYAEGTIDVIFDGINVTVKSGTIGENAASFGEDYTVTLEIAENYTVYNMSVSGFGAFGLRDINYTFDADTGVLTIPKEEIDGYGEGLQEINIEIYAMREYNADTDYKKVESVPFSDEFVIEEKNNIGIGMDDSALTGSMKLYEVELTKGQIICYEAVGTDTLDTDLKVYLAKPTDSENIFTELDFVDSDNKGYGEIGTFEAPETGAYVFIVVPFDHQFDEAVKFELKEMSEALDFTAETVPAPGTDDLWDWDADTKTLTLKDVMEIVAADCAIIVPDGTTINVEGKVYISALDGFDAICCLGDVIVNLKAGAELNLSGYSGIYTPAGEIIVNGEADADGNLPVLRTDVGDSGLLVYDDGHGSVIEGKTNSVIIDSVKLDMAGAGGITIYEGEVIISNCEVTADTENECIYVDYYDTEPSEDCGIVITDSFLNLMALDEAIQNYIGGVEIFDCDTMLDSAEQEGIDVSGSVNIVGGRINITSEKNNILADGYLYLTDVNFYMFMYNANGDYDIIEAYTNGEWGEFIVYDQGMNIIHEGKMTDEMIRMFEEVGRFTFSDENGQDIYPVMVVSKYNGGTDENAVDGVEEEYKEGSTLEFTTNSEGMDIDYPVWGFTRFKARTWEIVDTDLSGVVAENGNSVDISSLEAGTYTLRVRFEQQICQRNYWTFYNNPSDEMIDYVEVEFEVLADEEVVPPPIEDDEEEDVPPPSEGGEGEDVPPPVEDNENDETPPPTGDENKPVEDEDDKTPDTGAENFGFIGIIAAIIGVMTISVKKNKKSEK